MKSERGNGAIEISFEPPDLLLVAYVGDIQGHHILDSEPRGLQLTEALPYHFMLIDVSRLASFSPDARQRSAHSGAKNKSPIRGVAILGASFHYRAIGTLIVKAKALIYREDPVPLRFFDNDAQARAWIAERRNAIETATQRS